LPCLEKQQVQELSPEELLRQGDVKAFEKIFKASYQSMVQYAWKILNDREDAEEMVQQVFVTVWEKRKEINVQTSMQSYLYRAVHNRSLNFIEKNKVRKMYAEQNTETNTYAEPNTQLHHAELQTHFHLALEKLPEQCRKVFELSRFEGLKYSEIASRMGIAVKTVENQMGKALRILREELKDFLTLFVLMLLNDYFF
jgi:RNA polymerase sigma-70 factor (family 1)